MNDTTRRFLSEVLARVSQERLVDMRLFPAIRQGGIESAVAVLALEPRASVASVEETDSNAMSAPGGAVEDAGADMIAGGVTSALDATLDGDFAADESFEEGEVRARPSAHPIDDVADAQHALGEPAALLADRVAELRVALDASRETPSGAAADAALGGAVALADAASIMSDGHASRASSEREVPLHATTGDAPLEFADHADALALGDILALPAPEPNPYAPEQEPAAYDRLEIHSARYVFVFKGPERGKWTLDIVHEADAPLATLDQVVLGVARRSGDTAEPEQYTGESLRHTLDQPVWA